jgi:phosphohistidine phosphatase
MELFLLRHAIAVPRGTPGYRDDSQRPLTDEGAAKMERIAAGMRRLGVEFDVILTSPYRRAKETAQIAALQYDASRKVRVSERLAADGDPRLLIGELREAACDRVLLVGHEPYLSELLAVLLAGKDGMHLVLKKGGLCKITAEALRYGQCAELDWLLTPRQLALMARA